MTVQENLVAASYALNGRAPLNLKERCDDIYTLFPHLERAKHCWRDSCPRRAADAGDRPRARGRAQAHADRRSIARHGPVIAADIFNTITKIKPRARHQRPAVEQNATLALKHSSYGYVIDNGRVVIEGPSADLRTNPTVIERLHGRPRRRRQKQQCRHDGSLEGSFPDVRYHHCGRRFGRLRSRQSPLARAAIILFCSAKRVWTRRRATCRTRFPIATGFAPISIRSSSGMICASRHNRFRTTIRLPAVLPRAATSRPASWAAAPRSTASLPIAARLMITMMEKRGAAGWNWDNVLPYFRKVEAIWISTVLITARTVAFPSAAF